MIKTQGVLHFTIPVRISPLGKILQGHFRLAAHAA